MLTRKDAFNQEPGQEGRRNERRGREEGINYKEETVLAPALSLWS